MIVDRTRASRDPSTRRDRCSAPLQLGDRERLNLRVFVDHSIVEIFAEPDVWITSRVYPTDPASVGVKLLAYGGSAHVIALDMWEMASIWP